MEIVIVKEERHDRLEICRPDGSRAMSRFPHKGATPHDAVHWLVESTLGMRNAFWGMVAAGRHPEDIQAIAKQGGHPSASRAGAPAAEIVELLQAERLVECFEAALWDGTLDIATFREVAATACRTSHVALPELSDDAITSIDRRVRALADDWRPAPPGHMLALAWPA